MSFLEKVARGDYGVRFSATEEFEVTGESDSGTALLHSSKRFGLHLSWCPYRLDLSPTTEDVLRRDLERGTRDLFIQFRQRRTQDGAPSDRAKRYDDDPQWSPLISRNLFAIGGAPGLEVVHRLSHEPGSEIVMGHLLIPVATGLFEFRVTASAQMTGVKESILVAELLQRPDVQKEAAETSLEETLPKHMPPIDDPGLDERFSDHPLAIVRRALRWLRKEPQIAVIAPGLAQASGEVALPSLGCAITPPARYVVHEQKPDRAQFSRVSFATTDGVSILNIAQLPKNVRGPGASSEKFAEQMIRATLPDGSTDIVVRCRAVSIDDGPGGVEAQASFIRADCFPGQSVLRLFPDQLGRFWLAMIGTSQSVPVSEISDEISSVVRSFRLMSKPSWKFW